MSKRLKYDREFKISTVRLVLDGKQTMRDVAPNILNREFSADNPNQKWVGDITYIRTDEGWLYLAVIIDLFSRMVVGWSMSNHIDRFLVIAALKMAILRRNPPKGLLSHSDRGVQYASNDYREVIQTNGFDFKTELLLVVAYLNTVQPQSQPEQK